METSRLRTIEHPDRAAKLLESFIWSSETVPTTANKITAISELTLPLRRLASDGESGGCAWGAWTEGARIWFVSANPSLALARERGRPVLQIKVHDEEGDIIEAATYVDTVNAGWQLCA